MHDLGKMVMLNILEGCQRKERKGFKPTKDTITGLWSQYHADVGELAVAAWKMPEVIRQVVRLNQKLDEVQEDPGSMIAVTALGDQFCRAKGIGQAPEELDFEKSPAARRLNLANETCLELLERFYRTFDSLKSELM
jgi:HD-like signal output (HDOD) protein